MISQFSEAVKASGVVYGADHDEVIGPSLPVCSPSHSSSSQVSRLRQDSTCPEAGSGSAQTDTCWHQSGPIGPVPRPYSAMRMRLTPATRELGITTPVLRSSSRPPRSHRNRTYYRLDEMNLAHVERYFADFLSGVEANVPVLPVLAKDKSAAGARFTTGFDDPKQPNYCRNSERRRDHLHVLAKGLGPRQRYGVPSEVGRPRRECRAASLTRQSTDKQARNARSNSGPVVAREESPSYESAFNEAMRDIHSLMDGYEFGHHCSTSRGGSRPSTKPWVEMVLTARSTAKSCSAFSSSTRLIRQTRQTSRRALKVSNRRQRDDARPSAFAR